MSAASASCRRQKLWARYRLLCRGKGKEPDLALQTKVYLQTASQWGRVFPEKIIQLAFPEGPDCLLDCWKNKRSYFSWSTRWEQSDLGMKRGWELAWESEDTKDFPSDSKHEIGAALSKGWDVITNPLQRCRDGCHNKIVYLTEAFMLSR